MSHVDDIRFCIFDNEDDQAVVDLREVLFIAPVEKERRVNGKEGYRTLIQFKTGQVLYLKREFNAFLEDFATMLQALRPKEETDVPA